MRLNRAWIIRWCSFGDHAIPLIKKYAPKGDVVDVLSGRKSFKDAIEHVKSIYKFSILSLSEKLPHAHYTKGGKYSDDFFLRAFISTHEQSAWFRDCYGVETENPGSEMARKKWKEGFEKNSQYATIGINPYLELREVFNLTEKESESGKSIFTWDEREDGKIKNIIYKIPNTDYS